MGPAVTRAQPPAFPRTRGEDWASQHQPKRKPDVVPFSCLQSFPASGSFLMSCTTGISGFLLGWPWEAQSSPLVRGKAGGCTRVTAGPKRPHLGVKKHKLESRLLGEISIISDMQMTPPLWQKVTAPCLPPLICWIGILGPGHTPR